MAAKSEKDSISNLSTKAYLTPQAALLPEQAASRFLLRAAATGHAASMAEFSARRAADKDFGAALLWADRAAEAGSARGAFDAAYYRQFGLGAPQATREQTEALTAAQPALRPAAQPAAQ